MKRLAAVIVTTLALMLANGVTSRSPASAGGWAVTTLDAYPTPVAGKEIAVGFTILQHGVTPAQLEPSDKVGLEIRATSGATKYFPAVQQGPIGHYVATVTFAEAGYYTWTAFQGWFGPQRLGPLTVEAGDSSAAAVSGTSDDSAPAWLRYGLPLLAAMLGVYVLFDIVTSRRRSAVA